MGQRNISYHQVAKAADKIRRAGSEPSLTDICQELGVMAITPELNDFLEEWYSNQPDFKRKVQLPLSENISISTGHILEKNVELEKSLSILRATLESTADGIMMVNGQGKVVDWNQKFIEMWRIPSHMMEGGTESISFEYILSQLLDPDSLVSDVQYLYSHSDWQGELPELHFKDGRVFERYTQPQRIGDKIVGRVYSFRDVTQKRIAEDELRVRDRAIEASPHGVIILDVLKADCPVMYVNHAFQKITGFSTKQSLGKPLMKLLGGNVDEVNEKRLSLAIKEFKEEVLELHCLRRNGELFWSELSIAPVKDGFGQIRHYICILNDISERREMEQQLRHQATYDALTELPNRVLLMDRVEQAILMANKNRTILAFLFIDLDRFKMTNDSLGHGTGDKLLQVVANRLLLVTDDFDTVARLGGDEFAVLLTDLPNKEAAEERAKEVLQQVEKLIQIGQHSLKITASIGISYYPQDGKNYESLMKSADLSMYHAKDSGRNTYRVFEQEMKQRIINHMQLDTGLRDALKKQEMHVVYQPLIDLRSNKIIGFEALLRWNSKTLGQVSPLDFIPLAEENGQIIEIGNWVFKEACVQLKRWHDMGFKDLTMAVNLSSRQFRNHNLFDYIQGTCESLGIDPGFIELELTETLLIEEIDYIVKIMRKMKRLGLHLVIDDFGTGYSSLSYLKQFPVDKLKIDRSFIKEMVSDHNEAAITKAIIHLGHSLNLAVLAEGIENEFQKNFVIANGCDYAQGFYYSAPQKPDDILKYLVSFNKK